MRKGDDLDRDFPWGWFLGAMSILIPAIYIAIRVLERGSSAGG